MDPARAARLSLLAAIGIMVVWGCNFAVTKYILDSVGVSLFLFVRFTVMLVLGAALLAWVFRRHPRRMLPRRKDLPRFAAAGIIGHFLHVGVVTWGVNLSTAFSSSLVLTSTPLFTLLILAAMGVERLHARQVAGTLTAFAGIVLFLSDKFAAGFARAAFGDLALLVAAATFSLYTVISKPLAQRYGALMLLAWSLAFGAPPMVLVCLPAFLAADLGAVSAALWLALAWAILVSSFLGWLVWTWVNAVRGVARSAPLQYLMPPIAGVVAWLTLGETFTWLKIGAAAIVMGGVAWAQVGASARERNTAQPDPG
ncbi:MAG: DMT family transporter [Betaproteobacteria bacterium]|nr:DMT family transporter [Betaproteobacteria bacterium]